MIWIYDIETRIRKQGPCGSFCFKYWLGKGCDNCIDRKPKLFIYDIETM